MLVEKDGHLLELCRYVVLNPVRAGMVRQPEDYPWSSYLPTLGQADPLPCLTTDWLLANFGATSEVARRKYRQFVDDGMKLNDTPWAQVVGQVVLGSAEFVRQARERLDGRDALQEIPREQRHVGRPSLAELFPAGAGLSKPERDLRIRLACDRHGYTLKVVAAALGLHYTTISKVLGRVKFKT